jgi:hypothetical protein
MGHRGPEAQRSFKKFSTIAESFSTRPLLRSPIFKLAEPWRCSATTIRPPTFPFSRKRKPSKQSYRSDYEFACAVRLGSAKRKNTA